MAAKPSLEAAVWVVGPLCAAFLTPFDESFVYNFFFVWAPQLLVLLVLRVFGVSQSIRVLVACIWALLPVAIWAVFEVASITGEWWWTYLLFWPGAIAGAFLAPYLAVRIMKRPWLPTPAVVMLTLLLCLGANYIGIGVVMGWA